MKRIIFSFFIIVACFSNAKAQFYFGAGTSYINDGSSFGLGVNTLFEVADDRFLGSINGHYYLSGDINWDINLDAHYQFLEIGNDTYLNPFVGLNIRGEDEVGGDTDIGLGINLGLFLHTPVSDELRLYIEAKYSLVINGKTGLALAAGVFF